MARKSVTVKIRKSKRHSLLGFKYSAIAIASSSDDVLFGIHKYGVDFELAAVHLTWKGSNELGPEWPRTSYYMDSQEFREDILAAK